MSTVVLEANIRRAVKKFFDKQRQVPTIIRINPNVLKALQKHGGFKLFRTTHREDPKYLLGLRIIEDESQTSFEVTNRESD